MGKPRVPFADGRSSRSGRSGGGYSARRAACAPGTVCVCNQISRDEIVAAVQRGCRTLDRVSAATTAGAGQCGGTCRPEIAKLVDEVLAGNTMSTGSAHATERADDDTKNFPAKKK